MINYTNTQNSMSFILYYLKEKGKLFFYSIEKERRNKLQWDHLPQQRKQSSDCYKKGNKLLLLPCHITNSLY
jgi:hypothetical protein